MTMWLGNGDLAEVVCVDQSAPFSCIGLWAAACER